MYLNKDNNKKSPRRKWWWLLILLLIIPIRVYIGQQKAAEGERLTANGERSTANGGVPQGRDVNNPMQAEGAAWGNGTANGERKTVNGEQDSPSFGGGRGEVSLYATLGVSQLVADVAGDMQPAGMAPGVGVECSYFFARHWGVTLGVEAAFFNVRLFNAAVDAEAGGNAAALSLQKRTDKLYATYLRFPLWLRFRTPIGRHELQIAGGGSFDLALAGRQRTETEWRTGDGSKRSETTTGSLSFGNSASIAAEAGIRWRLGERWGLYTGVYAGYGLSDVLPANNALPGVTRIRLLPVGAKVKISF
jgi:hypothetical protein